MGRKTNEDTKTENQRLTEVRNMENKKIESTKQENQKSGNDIRVVFYPHGGCPITCGVCQRDIMADEFQYVIGRDLACDNCVEEIAPILIDIKSDIKKAAYDLCNFDFDNTKREIKEKIKNALNETFEQRFRRVVDDEREDKQEEEDNAVRAAHEAVRQHKKYRDYYNFKGA